MSLKLSVHEGGTDLRTGENTRPYKFGDFDILAVSLHPSTNDWAKFLYTVCSWLVPRPENEELILKFQPVPNQSDENWTDDFFTCVSWFRSNQKKCIFSTDIKFLKTKKRRRKKRPR
jgi:hypothetical protein